MSSDLFKRIDEMLSDLDKHIKIRQKKCDEALENIHEIESRINKIKLQEMLDTKPKSLSNIKLVNKKHCKSCNATDNLVYSGPTCRSCYQKKWRKQQTKLAYK